MEYDIGSMLYVLSLQVLVEPNNSLSKGLLLSPLLLGVAQISAHSEAVAHAAEQVDLPRLPSLDEGLLRLVTELGGEDLVDLCSDRLVDGSSGI
jgi:hypothetical protein